MKVEWAPLRQELARWRAARMSLPLWWRDDDAVSVTPALERLAALSGDLALPVHLAVVPAHADPSLATYCAALPGMVPMVHGWTHENHAPPGAKRAEFGQPRAEAAAQTEAALHRMQALFGSRLLPAFVPPWNRIDPTLVPNLAQQSYRGLSAFGARGKRLAAPGLVQINTHLDPIDWHGTRSLREPDILIATLVALLQGRRSGAQDAAEPLGVLTHHLVHDPAIWSFTHACLSELLLGGAIATDLSTMESLP